MRWLATMVLMVLMLTSCAKQEVTPITSGFACNVAVQYDNADYRGTLAVYEDGRTVLTLREPSTVAGLCLTYAAEQLTVTYAGMELRLEQNKIPAGAAARLLGKALEYTAKQAQPLPSCEIAGDIEGVSYVLQFDEQSGLPITLSVPEYNVSVTCSDWKDL